MVTYDKFRTGFAVEELEFSNVLSDLNVCIAHFITHF